MNRRDEVLLDKQMRRLIPPRHDGVIAIVLAAMFLVGLTSGIELGRKSTPQQIASNDAVIALAIPDNAVSVDRR